MLVVNLFGGAGCGKSTTRAGLFHLLKLKGIVCEEAIEYVKQKVYEGNRYVFTDQLYILAKQARILKQLNGKVDVAISDSPLLLSTIYGKNNSSAFNKVVLEEFNKYDNLNVVIRRVKPYQQIGRHHDEDSAKQKDVEVESLLFSLGIPYITVDGDEDAPRKILDYMVNGGLI